MKLSVLSSQFSITRRHSSSPHLSISPSLRLCVSPSPSLPLSPSNFNLRRATSLILLAASLTLTAACNQPPAVNPWRDDSIPSSEWSTPSAEGILAGNHPPAIRQRAVASAPAPLASGDVPHYPLWWEDPFEDKGDGDGQFAWTWADYLDMPYGDARFILNTLGWPVSAIVTLPGTPMVSDGQLSRGLLGFDHDAARGTVQNPTATLSDFGFDESGDTPIATDSAPAN